MTKGPLSVDLYYVVNHHEVLNHYNCFSFDTGEGLPIILSLEFIVIYEILEIFRNLLKFLAVSCFLEYLLVRQNWKNRQIKLGQTYAKLSSILD